MWVYYTIYVGLFILCLTRIKQKQFVYILIMVFLILFAGLRGNIDKDHLTYVALFKNPQSLTISVETSFYIISCIIQKFTGNVKYLFLTYAALAIIAKFYAIKKIAAFPFYSILIYYSFYYFLHEVTQIRVGVSVAFILLSLMSIEEKNLLKFIIFMIIAAFFHISAIIVLPFYFIRTNKIEKIYFLLIPIAYLFYLTNLNIVSLIKFVDIDIISLKFNFYLNNSKSQDINVFNALRLVRCLLIYFLLWKWDYLYSRNKYFIILIKFYILSFFFFVALADIPVIAYRVSDLFGIVELLIIPLLLYCFNEKYLVAAFVGLIGLLLLTYTLYYNKLALEYYI